MTQTRVGKWVNKNNHMHNEKKASRSGKKNIKCSICHATNSVLYGPYDSCKMGPNDGFEVQYSLLSKILAEKGHPTKN